MLTSANTLIKAIKQMWQRFENAKFASLCCTVGSFSCQASVDQHETTQSHRRGSALCLIANIIQLTHADFAFVRDVSVDPAHIISQ